MEVVIYNSVRLWLDHDLTIRRCERSLFFCATVKVPMKSLGLFTIPHPEFLYRMLRGAQFGMITRLRDT